MSGGFTALGTPTGTTSGTVASGDDPRLRQPSRAAMSASYLALSCHPLMTQQGTTQPAKDVWRYMPMLLRTDLAIDGFAVNVTAQATGGTAALIFGLFALDGNARPATRQADYSTYGSIDVTTGTGILTLAAAGITIPAGEWCIGCAWSGTATTAPIFTSHAGIHPSVASLPAAVTATGYSEAISGASVPASASPAASATAGVLIFGKIH